MAIPADHTMIWAEVYTGIPGRPKTKCLNYGWCAFPKQMTFDQAAERAKAHLKRQHGQKALVLTYPMDRVGKGFRASDPIIGVFG